MSESASYQVNQRLLGSEQSTLYISDRDNDQNMLGTYRQGESAQNVADRISALDYVKNTGFVSSVAPADVRITRFSPYEDEPKTAITQLHLKDPARANRCPHEPRNPACA